MPSRRLQQIEPSPTLEISALASRMRADGVDVLDFSAGQPDFPTPLPVKEAGKRAIDADRTRYTANEGVAELRRAIADKLLRDNGLRYAPEEILVSPGAKASLYFAAMALLDPGGRALVPVPYWVSYPAQVRLAGAEPVFVPTDEANGFKLTGERLRARVDAGSRLLILNYPSNPTGACYTAEELERIAGVCREHDIWVLADEIYEKLLYDGREFVSIASLDGMRERTVVINGMSKTYSMTGWRIGYAAAPREAIRAMSMVQSHSTSNATSISQWASVEALGVDDVEIDRRRQEFQTRRDLVYRELCDLEGVSCVLPEGSFYIFPDVSGLFGRAAAGTKLEAGVDFARYLLEQARVAVVPGEAFGSAAHVRLSYADSLERLQEGMERIRRAVGELH